MIMFKKIIAFLLAVCLVFSALFCAGAVEPEQEKFFRVMVPGVNTRDILYMPGTDDAVGVFPPSTDAILSVVEGALPVLGKFACTRDWDAFAVEVSGLVMQLFDKFACDENGNSKENVGIDWEYPEEEIILESDNATFYYDWRLDPLYVAEQLDDYIDYILEVRGEEKVVVECHSMGGVITLSYFANEGEKAYDKVHSVLFDSTAIFGTSVAGEPMNGKIAVNGTSLANFLYDSVLGMDAEALLHSIFDVINEAGIFDGVGVVANNIVDKIIATVYEECAIDIFASVPGIWALTPAENFEAAKKLCFEGERGEKYAGLIEKIDNYDLKVRRQAVTLLKEIDSRMNIGVFSRYNYQITPVIETWNVQSDMVIDTKFTSFGATCAPLGETLGEGYVQKNTACGHNHLSIDGVIDASTCLFPEYTWFIKDIQHSFGMREMEELRDLIFNSEKQVTVHDYEEFPQFMSYDPAEETFSPLGVPQVETKSPFMAWISGTKASVFVNVYYQFFKLIADSVVSVFK